MLPPILLVEDNPVDLDLALRAFRMRNLPNRLEVARDGEEALSWIAKWDSGTTRPAVILLDLNLPKVSGLDVLRALKNHLIYKCIPVVVLTTSTQDTDLRAAYDAGVNSYIVKPVQFEAFMTATDHISLYWVKLNHPYPGK